MFPILFTALVPLALFTVFWWFGQPENHAVSLAVRYRLAVIIGWAFLLVPILCPPLSNQAKQFLQGFAGAVCAASALGFALLAIRLSSRVRIAATLLLVASIALTGFSLWHYASRLADLR